MRNRTDKRWQVYLPLQQTLSTERPRQEQVQYTSNHRHRVGDLQHSLEHEVRHHSMNTLELVQGVGSGVGGYEELEDGSGHAISYTREEFS